MATTKNRPTVWVKQTEWDGNPELGLEHWMKYFENPYTDRLVPVSVFGKGDHWTFSVKAGVNSDFSYSGCFYPRTTNDAHEFMAWVDERYRSGKLFY